MHPYSRDTAKPQAAMIAPTTQRERLRPTLPTDFTIAPGVAKMPLPITREMTRMYALGQLIVLPSIEVSGITSSSIERETPSVVVLFDSSSLPSRVLELSAGEGDREGDCESKGCCSSSVEAMMPDSSKFGPVFLGTLAVSPRVSQVKGRSAAIIPRVLTLQAAHMLEEQQTCKLDNCQQVASFVSWMSRVQGPDNSETDASTYRALIGALAIV